MQIFRADCSKHVLHLRCFTQENWAWFELPGTDNANSLRGLESFPWVLFLWWAESDSETRVDNGRFLTTDGYLTKTWDASPRKKTPWMSQGHQVQPWLHESSKVLSLLGPDLTTDITKKDGPMKLPPFWVWQERKWVSKALFYTQVVDLLDPAP